MAGDGVSCSASRLGPGRCPSPAAAPTQALCCLPAPCRATLPRLRELQLANADSRPPGGDALLRRLVAGAAPSLRQLNLHGMAVNDLCMLAGATALTWLDLSSTPLGDRQLADAALLPLCWLSLARTGVGDEGVGQLLAAPLTRLDLRWAQEGAGRAASASAAAAAAA